MTLRPSSEVRDVTGITEEEKTRIRYFLQGQIRENPAKYPAKLAGYDVTYDFVYVDEESFEKYKPTSFRQLMEAFKEYKEKI